MEKKEFVFSKIHGGENGFIAHSPLYLSVRHRICAEELKALLQDLVEGGKILVGTTGRGGKVYSIIPPSEDFLLLTRHMAEDNKQLVEGKRCPLCFGRGYVPKGNEGVEMRVEMEEHTEGELNKILKETKDENMD